jgi:hypothetical protein
MAMDEDVPAQKMSQITVSEDSGLDMPNQQNLSQVPDKAEDLHDLEKTDTVDGLASKKDGHLAARSEATGEARFLKELYEASTKDESLVGAAPTTSISVMKAIEDKRKSTRRKSGPPPRQYDPSELVCCT